MDALIALETRAQEKDLVDHREPDEADWSVEWWRCRLRRPSAASDRRLVPCDWDRRLVSEYAYSVIPLAGLVLLRSLPAEHSMRDCVLLDLRPVHN